MHYRSFRIQNFKGIKDAFITISESEHARVHTLVGLNESGKTTILEAIHSFSPDDDTRVIVGSDLSEDRGAQDIVPRYAVSDFTGDISVEAEIVLNDEDISVILKSAGQEIGGSVQLRDPLCRVFKYKKFHRYVNGEFKGKYRQSELHFEVKKSGRRKFYPAEDSERSCCFDALERVFPKIAYFPTFVFDFPDKIYLSGRLRDRRNAFYRRVFQDILDFDDRGHTIEQHIVVRTRKDEFLGPWSFFFGAFRSSGEGDKIDQVIDRAAQTVTRTIFRKWNEIFGEKVAGKEVIIPWDIDEGLPTVDVKGNKTPSEKHDLFIQFRIKDGSNRYNVEDRSLGFRWFFAFLLFTQFRVARRHGNATIFLFDEPASNLHSAAQQKLIESFPEIAKQPHALIYSTHSHYMIEPKWLEQAFIVDNGVSGADESVFDSGLTDDRSLNIQVTPFKKFVHEFPTKTSYFQPIMDRLDVKPSKFDLNLGGLIVEGKSDYYIIRYASEHLFRKKTNIFPVAGAGTMGALIALQRGWGLPVRVLLDADHAGKREQRRYEKEYSLSEDEIFTLERVDPALKTIEDILSDADKRLIADELSLDREPAEGDIMLFFQARLVSGKKTKLSKECVEILRKMEQTITTT